MAVYRAQLPVRRDMFEIAVDSRDTVRRVADEARSEMGRQAGELESFEDALGQRLVSALQLLGVPQVAARERPGERGRV